MDKDPEEDQHQDAEVLENTRRNSGGDAAGLRVANGSAPNPFTKTLASMENKYNQKVEQKIGSQGLDWSAAEKGAAEKAKAAEKKQKVGLDVDSFTRLLLTGKTASGSAGASSAAIAALTPQPTSNTGVTGATFGVAPSARPNVKTNTQTQDDERDLSDLESASSDESDEEYTTPLSRKIEQADIEKRSIPAPSIQPVPRGPQTVGFSDWDSFDSTLPSTSSTSTTSKPPPALALKPAPPPSRRNRAHSGDSPSESPQPEAAKLLAPRPPRPRKTSSHLDPTDLPDVLPPQPSMPAPPRPRAHSNLSIKSSNSSTMDTPTETPPSPTGPIAHSALRLRGDSTASTSSLTPSLTAKPPPPPARRAAPKPPSATALLTTNTSQSVPDDTTTYLDVGRRPSPAGLSSSARSSPNASSRTALSAMPPPPPPKRRGSSKGSLDISNSRRGSATRPSQEGARPSLAAAMYAEDDEQGGVMKKDMFADLDALQKEVDALRKQYR